MNHSSDNLIRNSTTEFLIFTAQAGENSIEARYEEETIWLSKDKIALLFGVGKVAISKHLANIFESGELQKQATVSILETVQQEGNRNVTTKRQ